MTEKALRQVAFLRRRYRIIVGYTGLIGAIIGALVLTPLLLLPFYPEEVALARGFLLPGLLLIGLGAGFWWRLAFRQPSSLTYQEGTVIVVLSWGLAIVCGAIPLMMVSDLSLTQALFESTSGWTTTGLSVVDVTAAPRLILFYRSVMQLAGGAGLAILMLSALAGPAGAGISSAEGRAELLVPHVRRSAKLVVTIYSGYIVLGVLLLNITGMSLFDAVNHAFAALSTGGFSTRSASIGYWDSPAIEAVTIVLMLLGTLNFLTSYMLLRGKWRVAMHNGEIRLESLLIPLSALLLFFGITWELYATLGKSMRVAIFETVTALSTTGFSTVGYSDWQGVGWLVLLILMLIGGGTGSTAGAIKQYRIYVLYCALVWEVRRMFLPKGAVTEVAVWQGERRHFLSDAYIRQISLFVFIYIVAFLVGSLILTLHGYSLQESLFEFASSLGTVGLSVGVTASDAPIGVLWAQIVGMVLGRLEFFTVMVGLCKIFLDTRTFIEVGHRESRAAN